MKAIYAIVLVIIMSVLGCAKKNEFPSEAKVAFMRGCVTNDHMLDYCMCALDEIQHRATFEEYAAMEAIGVNMQLTMEIARACKNRMK